MALTIKELLAADTVSQAADKINFNFDQLLLNGGGPAGPQGPQGPPGPIGGRGIRGSQWYEDPNPISGPTDPNNIVPPFPDLEPNDSYLASDGNVWEYDGTAWVNTGIDLTGPQGIAAQGLWSETGPNPIADQEILYPSTYGLAGNVRSTFVGGVPSTDTVFDPNFVIDANILSSVNSGTSSFNIQVPTDGVSAIKFFGSTNAGDYTNDIAQAQAINLLQGDSLVFQDLNNSTALSANAEYGYRFSTLNRSMLIRTGRSFKVETGSTTISGLSEDGDITLRVLDTGIFSTSKIILDNKESANVARLEVGGSENSFTGNTLAGNIFSESKNIWHGVSNDFTVFAKGSADAITLDASTDGNIVLYANNDIYLNTVGPNSVSNIYIGDPDPLATANFTDNIQMLSYGNGGITIRRSSDNGEGILVETGRYWNYLNNTLDHLDLVSANQTNIKAKNLSTFTAGAQTGDFSTIDPVSGATTPSSPSDGNVEITAHGGDIFEAGGKIINRLKPTFPSSTGEGQFIVINSTRNNNSITGDGDMTSIKVETNKRGRVTIGQWQAGDSIVENSVGVPSMDGMALYVNSTVDPDIPGTSSSYSKVYPLIKIGNRPRAGDVYNLKNDPSTGKDGGYFGGGAHIVGPYGSDKDLKFVGLPPSQNLYGREPWSALHLRGGTKYGDSISSKLGGTFAPGAVWLYAPVNTLPVPDLVTSPTTNSIRLWGTRTSTVNRSIAPDVNPGTTQGGATIGLNMLAETAIQPPGTPLSSGQRGVGAGQDTVVGRVGLYGRAAIDDYPARFSQSPNNLTDTTFTSGTWVAEGTAGTGGTDRSIFNPADTTYAGVNVGDEYRSRQTFKVFGEYVGDHYSSQFGGDYFGPTVQNDQFLSGAQGNTGFGSQNLTSGNYQDQYVRTSAGEIQPSTQPTAPFNQNATITFSYRYSWQKVGRTVTFSGLVHLANPAGAQFSSNASDLLILSSNLQKGQYGRALQLRMPLPIQLNKGGQRKNRGGYIATGTGNGLRGAVPGSMNGVCRGLFNDDENMTPAYREYFGEQLGLNGTAWNGTVGGGTVEHGSNTQIYYDAGASEPSQTSYMWLQLDGMSPFNAQYYIGSGFGDVTAYTRSYWGPYGGAAAGTVPSFRLFNTQYKFSGTYEINPE